MGYIRYRSRILFIQQGDPVGFIKNQRNIEYRESLVILGVPKLDEIDISCLAVFVRRIIGNIYLLLMVPAFIPIIQETNDLVFADGV